MCVYNVADTEILEEDMVAYKIVFEGVFEEYKASFSSICSPDGRLPQPYPLQQNREGAYPDPFGTVRLYEIGLKAITSFETTPGLYCYISEIKAFEDLQYYSQYASYLSKVLEVLIPKGTKIRRASSYNFGIDYNDTVFTKDKDVIPFMRDTILTEELIPIKVIPKDSLLIDLDTKLKYERKEFE